MRFSKSDKVRLATKQKSAANSSSLRPQEPRRSRPGIKSRVTLLMYFSREAHWRKRSKQARKMALRTQLQGWAVLFRPILRPKPTQALHLGAASAKVSDLVHSI